jgi:hypothetical protein
MWLLSDDALIRVELRQQRAVSDYIGSAFERACRFDQFSIVIPLKWTKSLSLVVANKRP